jgi:AcrR family transcriptional regulator
MRIGMPQRKVRIGRSATAVRPIEIGLREQHKLDKLSRIKAAATKLFSERGFDGATTREIAREAHVSQATIFQYVQNKSELALLVFSDDLERAHKASYAAIRPDMPLLEKLVTVLSGSYKEFVKNVRLTRALVKTVTIFETGKQAKLIRQLRRDLIGKFEEILTEAKRSGVIHTQEDIGFIARDLFCSVHPPVRFWLANDDPDTFRDLTDLRRTIKLHVHALEPTPEAFGVDGGSKS